jgi:hypothetical protein
MAIFGINISSCMQSSLPASCVFPQALDNQFVPETTFHAIFKGGRGLDHHREDIDLHVKRELHRALIYSPCAVINRAAFVSTHPLFSSYGVNASQESIEATAHLLKDRALVPMLFSEGCFSPDELRGRLKFGVHPDGFDSLDHLFHTQGMSPIEGFVPDPNVLKNSPSVFRNYFSQLAGVHKDWVSQVGNEIFGPRWEDQMAEPFLKDVRSLGRWFIDNCDNDNVTRDLVYQNFLVRDPKNVAGGEYANPRGLWFPFQIKQLVDLRYVSNIPDQLARITLTPDLFPSRTALQDFAHQMHFEGQQLSDLVELVSRSAKELYYHLQSSFTLPALEHLDFPAIWRIRQSEAWAAFIEVQNKLLTFDGDSHSFLEAVDKLPAAFNKLQAHVAKVISGRLHQTRTRKLSPMVAIAISAGAGAFTWWLTGKMGETLAAATTAQLATDHLPEKIQGLAIKIALNFIDDRGVVDRAMSTTIEAVRSRAVITKEEIRQLVAAAGSSAVCPRLNQQTAEIDNV